MKIKSVLPVIFPRKINVDVIEENSDENIGMLEDSNLHSADIDGDRL